MRMLRLSCLVLNLKLNEARIIRREVSNGATEAELQVNCVRPHLNIVRIHS